MSILDFESAKSLLGQQVKICGGNSSLELTANVAEVNTLVAHGEEWQSFSVLFSGDTDLNLAQGTYDVVHESFGSELLFISPTSNNEAEAVITRRIA